MALTLISQKCLCEKYAIVEGAKYNNDDIVQMYLDNVWNPNMSITGADGLPQINMAGNLVRASTGARISMKHPPFTLEITNDFASESST